VRKPGVQSDLPQPSAERTGRSQSMEVPPDLHERFLRKVVCERRVTAPAPEKAPNGALPPMDELAESAVVSRARECDERAFCG